MATSDLSYQFQSALRPPPVPKGGPTPKAPAPTPKKPTPHGKGNGIYDDTYDNTDQGKQDAADKAKAAQDLIKGNAAQDAADAAAKAAEEAAAAQQEAANRDAAAMLRMMLEQWGLGSLADTATELAMQGLSVNEIVLQLRQSDAYKTRFAGNQQRISNGYAALEPADYLAVEDAYQRILQSAGMPKGFYDDPSDFAGWIGNNVSASEIQERVDLATDAVQNTDPNYLKALGQMGLGTGDLAATMLDQSRAMPILRRTVGTAKLGQAAMDAGLNFNQGSAGRFYDVLKDSQGGIDFASAKAGYSQVASALPAAQQLSAVHGIELQQSDLENEFLGRDETASAKRKRLAQAEMVDYQGSGGTNEKSLVRRSRGEY